MAANGICSIGKVDDAAYYENYAAMSRVAGRWLGDACATVLGIQPGSELPIADGPQRGQLSLVLDGINPLTGDMLPARKHAVKGYDVTFSPPKSFSIVASLADDAALRDRLWTAHRQAVENTLAWFERELASGRRGYSGRAGNVHATIMSALFDHETSRSDDPQVHTHCVIPNLGLGVDGKLGALDTRLFWSGRSSREQIVSTLGEIYAAELRLASSAFLAWERRSVPKASWEVAGVPKAVVKEFSRRRSLIVDTLADMGIGTDATHRKRMVTTLAGREAKTEKLARDLLPEWQARLAQHGFTASDLTRAVQTRRQCSPQTMNLSVVLHRLCQDRPTFTRHDLVGAIAAGAAAGISVEDAERLADEALADDKLCVLVRAAPNTDTVVRLAGEARYTSRQLFDRERVILDHATEHVAAGVPDEQIEAAMGGLVDLDSEQNTVMRAVLSSQGLTIVRAGPGSGKTYVLGRAAKVWAVNKTPVVGLALSWSAALELREAGVPHVAALAAWRAENRVLHGDETWLPRNGVVVLDEASMIPTAELANVLAAAAKRHCKVVLVGDDRQLSSVESGGMFAQLVDRFGAVEMLTNRRQADPSMRRAVEAVRRGASTEAAQRLQIGEHITVSQAPEHALAAMLDAWSEARSSGDDVVLFSATRDGRDALNRLAHERRVTDGELDGPTVLCGATTAHNGVPEREYREGETLRCLKQQAFGGGRLWNGREVIYRGQLQRGSATRHMIELAAGKTIEVTDDYLAEHTDYGYASTIHSAQGKTVGTAAARRGAQPANVQRGRGLLLAPESLALEAAHVALSRATDSTQLFVWIDPSETATGGHLTDRSGNPIEPQRDPLRQLARAWGATNADVAATAEQAAATEVARLVGGSSRSQLEAERQQLAHIIGLTTSASPERLLAVRRNELAARTDEERATAGVERNDVLQARQLLRGRDLIRDRARLDVLDEALAVRRQLGVLDVMLDPVTVQARAVRTIIGDPPTALGAGARWEQAAGSLLDAAYWVGQARARSDSASVRAAAQPELVWRDVVDLAGGVGTWCATDDLMRAEAADCVRGEVGRVLGWRDALGRESVERQLLVYAWAGRTPTTSVLEQARQLARSDTTDDRAKALATALRTEAWRIVQEAAQNGQTVPVPIAAAVRPGFTLPAVRELAAAVEERNVWLLMEREAAQDATTAGAYRAYSVYLEQEQRHE